MFVVQAEDVSERLASDSKGEKSRGVLRQPGDDSLHSVMGHQSAFGSTAESKNGSSGTNDVCVTCRQTYAKSAARVKRSTHPTKRSGDVVHIDIIVWSQPLSVPNGNKYSLAIRDVHSRWAEVIHMTSKSHALKAFQTFVDTTPVPLRPGTIVFSDSESVFATRDFLGYLKRNGFVSKASPPYQQWKNGIVERYIGMLKKVVSALLTSAQLSNVFWSMAASHAAYLLNRSPSTALEGTTPYEKLFGGKPVLAQMRVFGEPVLVNMQKTTAAKQGMWVGFDDRTNSHKVYMHDTRRLVVSAEATFLTNRWGSGVQLNWEDSDTAVANELPLLPPLISASEAELKAASSAVEEVEAGEGHDATPDSEPVPVVLEEHPPVVDAKLSTSEDLDGRPQLTRRTVARYESSASTHVMLSQGGGSNVPLAEVESASSERRDKDWRSLNQFETCDNTISDYLNLLEYGGIYAVVADEDDTPTLRKALESEDYESIWKPALEREMKTLVDNGVLRLVLVEQLPASARVLRGHVILTKKRDAEGSFIKGKARLVIQGNRQKAEYGDYDPADLASYTFQFSSLLMVLTVAVNGGWKIENSDVDTAFHNSELEEELYMYVPPLLVEFFPRNSVFKVEKGLYGLKQAPRLWYKTLVTWLFRIGFSRMVLDPCLFLYRHGEHVMYLLVWVDDFIYTSDCEDLMKWFKEEASQRFSMKHLGDLTWCLQLKVDYERGKSMTITQKAYIEELGEVFRVKPGKRQRPPFKNGIAMPEGVDKPDSTVPYRKIVGALQYISTRTRPDISFAVSSLARFCNKYTREHFNIALGVLEYLLQTSDVGIRLDRADELKLICYTDASWGSWAGIDRHSITGMCMFLGGNLVNWKCCAQRAVSRSSAEAEYMALDVGVKTSIYLRNLLQEMGINVGLVTLRSDSQSAIAMVQNEGITKRAKHIDIVYHFVRDHVGRSLVMEFCPTELMIADMLTKPLCYEKVLSLRLHANKM